MKGEVNILHLSDLHIEDQSTDGQNEISLALQNLIDDIRKQTLKIDELIIVVTGDLLYQASYEKNANCVELFFEKLKDSVQSKIKGIVIVPGNHDITRGEKEANIIANRNLFQETNNSKLINFNGYDQYLLLLNRIRKLYGITPKKQKSYGVDVFECNGINIAFQCFDTAWGVTSNSKKGDIEIGLYQLKTVERQYKNKRIALSNKGTPINLTLAVSHYPLSWLNANDSNEAVNSMMDINFLNTDLLLCGHTHDTEILNYVNHEHSLMTLVTGIGWGVNRPSDAKDQHRYSIYQLSATNNVCEVIMRRTNKNQKFDYDYSLYTEEHEKVEKKIVYPLRMNGTVAFLKQNAVEIVDTKNIQVCDRVLDLINTVAMSISHFRESSSLLLEVYKRNFLDILSQDSSIERNGKLYNNIRGFLYNDIRLTKESLEVWRKNCNSNQTYAKNVFESYLRDICSKFIVEFEDVFPFGTVLRAHFRKHQMTLGENSSTYVTICEDNSGKNIAMPPKEVPWGGLIKSSYIIKKSLINTVNRDLNNIATNWDDFLTLVPHFEGNELEIRIGTGKSRTLEKRPIISFGVSIKNQNQNYVEQGTLILSIISFLKIEKHLSYLIDEYIRLFYLPLKNFYCQTV